MEYSEYLDITDENGNLTGKTKSREAIHRDGDWHKTVHAWLINSRHELLIQKRAAAVKAHPNKWHVSIAGHIRAGEDSLTAAVKETSEEIGIKIDPKNIEYLFTVKNREILNNGTLLNNHLNDVYLVPLDLDIDKIKLQPEEVSEVKFIPFLELEKIISSKDANFVRLDEEYEKLFKLLHQRYEK